MKHPPLRLFRAMAVGGAAALGPLLLAGACGGASSPVGAGASCSLASDCQPGLVCVEQADKTSICSSDLTRVAGKPPPEGGVPDASVAEASADARPPPDAGPPDAPSNPRDTGTD